MCEKRDRIHSNSSIQYHNQPLHKAVFEEFRLPKVYFIARQLSFTHVLAVWADVEKRRVVDLQVTGRHFIPMKKKQENSIINDQIWMNRIMFFGNDFCTHGRETAQLK